MARDPFVVIGGDAAGLSAASKFRREADREVIVFEKGQWVSYAHCGLPYFVEGSVERLTDLLSLSPSDIEDRGIDLRRGHEVVSVDPTERTVTVRTDGERFDQPYSELLVATGARATTGAFDASLDGVFTIHGLDSAAAVDAYLAPPGEYDRDRLGDGPVDDALIDHNAALDPPERVAIVGGGYVGIEMAEALTARGLDVHLFQRSDHVLPPFGAAVAERVEPHLDAQGVTLHTGTVVDELVGADRIEAVVADDSEGSEITRADSEAVDSVERSSTSNRAEPGDGERYPVEMALLGVGIQPNTELLDGTGVARGPSGAVRTDAYGRTTLPAVYAAGDVATARHAVTGAETWVPLGLTANRAGRAIGATVAGDPTPVGNVAGTAVVKAFDLECGRVGLVDEDVAADTGFDPVSETITAGSRSGYYPGGDETTVTLVADRRTGRVLGGAIVGRDRAAIRIDTLATAIEAEMTLNDLERLDLAYAPPFSPVWDPVLVAAKVVNGRLES
ncbi:FAD-dependent oxidoreductase [Haloplanus aerogenes]|uniref:NADPH-dependent 2,4-dienoyl-CoA reductase/sulfur reductase-like enzyme n=1 Tax=Haloplanus aerogenes TaxID=660522 RepID=A0A3M0DAL1_9EURY|nr:FAD-dependent oxidoreductase [Haloplanus aerogenes]AZH26238.1 pyridine nucleotide-disulfide oxidoreductase [Haloplanus aerogenes]RMB18305.1 NADPH-dependent 2,4-dienoyl-CoA reductase/sulfur reductase-like enzyme [Haloplanus aerogenes]